MAEEVDVASAALIARLINEDANAISDSPIPDSPSAVPQVQEVIETTDISLVTETQNGERRSKRARRRPRRFEAGFSNNFHDDGIPRTLPPSKQPARGDKFIQVECQEEALQNAPYRVIMHPCAKALMELHSHLTETEVIGYLGGTILKDTSSHKTIVYIEEAFPAQCLHEHELHSQGRDAYYEVEMRPESDVEVRTRVALKGLSIVGWYHSHPTFSVQPSTIDVENQCNYQNLIYKWSPYIAAIVGPFSEEHKDFRTEMIMFYVKDEQNEEGENENVPVRLDCEILEERPGSCGGDYYRRNHSVLCRASALENEAADLIALYATHHRKTKMFKEWRDGLMNVDKLEMSLRATIGDHITRKREENGFCKLSNGRRKAAVNFEGSERAVDRKDDESAKKDEISVVRSNEKCERKSQNAVADEKRRAAPESADEDEIIIIDSDTEPIVEKKVENGATVEAGKVAAPSTEEDEITPVEENGLCNDDANDATAVARSAQLKRSVPSSPSVATVVKAGDPKPEVAESSLENAIMSVLEAIKSAWRESEKIQLPEESGPNKKRRKKKIAAAKS